MGFVYSAPILGIASSVIQDLFHIQPGATTGIIVLRCSLTQSSDYGDAAAEGLRIQVLRRSTLGTGGTAVTPLVHLPGAPASNATVTRTIVTTQGTLVEVIGEEAFNIQAGFLYAPIPEERLLINAGGNRLAFFLANAPTDPITVSGWLTWLEVR